jgi:hypothetical protein
MSKYNKNSFIKSPRIFDKKFLDLNTLPKIVQSNGDVVYTIEPDYDERPDILADKIYGSSELWWVFALRNPDVLYDPIRDFKTGVDIILPSESAVQRVVRN